MKIAYEHLVEHINSKPSIDEISKNLFQLGHEHEIENSIFDIEFTPNRGDCLSLNGLLRELQLFYEIDSKHTLYREKINNFKLDFVNNDKNACNKITFLKLQINEEVLPYTGELESYFTDLDNKKNNFFTDISNYISYETGQPTHCYDLGKIDNQITLETSSQSESFISLLDKKIELKDKNLVFKMSGNIINLAGIIGDKSTACSKKTREVLIECAYFQPEKIIGKSVIYDIKSEAAYKFERGVNPSGHEKILRRFLKIVEQHAEIINVSIFKEDYTVLKEKIVPFDVNRICSILGVNIDKKNISNFLTRLDFIVSDKLIQIPHHRSDIASLNDIAEEIARSFGYDNIPVESISIPKLAKSFSKDSKTKKLRKFLINKGFFEVINNPFAISCEKKSLRVDNPLDSNKRFMRLNMKESLIKNLIYNERRQHDSIKLFVISDVYSFDETPIKKTLIGIIASGRLGNNYEEFSKKIDHKYIQSILADLYNEDSILIKSIPRESLDTKIKDEIFYVEADINELSFKNDKLEFDNFSLSKEIKYSPISEYPSSYRDLSFSVKNQSSLEALQKLILTYENKLIKSAFIFDFFINEKKQEIKIGFRIIFQSLNKTITDNEINLVIDCIIKESTKIDWVTIPGIK